MFLAARQLTSGTVRRSGTVVQTLKRDVSSRSSER